METLNSNDTQKLKNVCTNRAEAAQGLGRPLVSVYSDYAGRCEVLRLLLLLLIEPTSQNIRDEIQSLLNPSSSN